MSSVESQNLPSQDIKTATSSHSTNKKSELPTRNSIDKVKPGGTSVSPEGGQDQSQQDGVASTSNDSNSKDEAARQKKEKLRLKRLAQKQKMKADKAKLKLVENTAEKQPDTVNVQLPIPKDAQSSKASGSATTRVASTSASASKDKAKQLAAAESDNESETWTAGEDEDDSRPVLSAVKSDKQQEQKLTKSQIKKQKQKQKQIKQEFKDQSSPPASTQPVQPPSKATSKTDKSAASKPKLPAATSEVKLASVIPSPLPLSNKPAKRQNPPAVKTQKMFVPPAFAATAPPPSDLLECYNEPDSRAITKYSNDGNHKTQMHLRVSLRPLPKLPAGGTERQQYKKRMGVVELDLVVQSRKNRDLASNVRTPQVYSQNKEPVRVGYQAKTADSITQKERSQPDLETIVMQNAAPSIVRPSSAPPVPSSVVSLSDHLAGSLSLSGSSVASTSIPTPPLPSKAEETTFYTSSPALEAQDSAIINLGRRLEAEEKPSFIPASTAVISTTAAPTLPPTTHQQSDQLHARLAESVEETLDYHQPGAALVPRAAYPSQHHQMYRPVQSYGYEQPSYYGHGQSQPFQAMDGTYWQLNAYGHAVPFYGYSSAAMYGPAVQQPYFHQQPQPHYILPHGNPAVQHLSEGRGAQPYDSPPYSPHDSFSPIQHQHTGHSASFPHSASLGKVVHNAVSYPAQGFYPATSSSSSSSAVASQHQQHSSQQPHPLSLPPQMPSPIYPYPSQGSGYTYDPETGLMTDETGLVFPPQHQPMMQSYHGPVRPLSEFHTTATEATAQ